MSKFLGVPNSAHRPSPAFAMKIAYFHREDRGTIVMPMTGKYENTLYCASVGVFKEDCVLYY